MLTARAADPLPLIDLPFTDSTGETEMFKDVRVTLLRMTRPSDFTTTERHTHPAVQVGGRIFIGQTDVTSRVVEVLPR